MGRGGEGSVRSRRLFRGARLSGLVPMLGLVLSLTSPSRAAEMRFAEPIIYGGMQGSVGALESADLNGDGRTDLIVGSNSRVSVLLNNGRSKFLAPVHYAVPARVTSLAVADFNGDRRQDVAASTDYRRGVYVLLGRGNGTLGAAVRIDVPPPDSPLFDSAPVTGRSIAAADLNADGRADLVLGNFGFALPPVYLGRPTGSFQAVRIDTPVGVPVLADFDRDGVLDIGTHFISHMVVQLGLGDGTFAGTQLGSQTLHVFRVAAADMNRDGWLDWIVTVAGPGSAELAIVTRRPGQADTLTHGLSNPYYPFRIDLALADFDGDAAVDVATVGGGTTATWVIVHRGLGDGHVETAFARSWNPDQFLATAIHAADFGGSSRPDLVVGADGVVLLFLNETIPDDDIFMTLEEFRQKRRWAIKDLQGGDVNGDASVGVLDALSGLRIAARIDPLTTVAAYTGNLTGRNTVGVTDVVQILRASVGLIPLSDLKPQPITGLSAVRTLPSEEVSAGGATLAGEVALDPPPADGIVEYRFRLRLPSGQESETTSEVMQAREASILEAKRRVEGLQPSSTYQARLVVSRPALGEGEWVTFTTKAQPPSPTPLQLVTLEPEAVTQAGATLRGTATLPVGVQARPFFRLRNLTGQESDGTGSAEVVVAANPAPLVGTGSAQPVSFAASAEAGVALQPNSLYSVTLGVEEADGTQEQASSVQFRTGFEVVEGVDSDGDGFADVDETALASDPSSAASVPPLFQASPLVSYRNGPGEAPPGEAAAGPASAPTLSGGSLGGAFRSGSTGADGPLVFFQPPPPSQYTLLAYDSDRQVVVLFHGTGPPLAEYETTWEWNGERWNRKKTAHNPGLDRSNARMAYDASRRVVVFYGGMSSGTAQQTWEYDGTDWTLKPTTTSPRATNRHGMVYDPVGRRVLLAGGADILTGLPVDELWSYDGRDWTLVGKLPEGRVGHGAVWDSRRQRLVLYGGYTASGSLAARAQTWEWDGREWEQKDTVPNPGLREGHSMVYDPLRGETLLFGNGYSAADSHELWSWNGERWLRLEPAASPPGRLSFGFAFDEARGQAVVFGGTHLNPGRGLSNDTWLWDGTHWSAPLHLQPEPVIDLSDHPDGIYHYTQIDIPAGVKLSFVGGSGHRPLVWLASGDVSIAGEVDLNGQPGLVRGGPSPIPGSEAQGGPGGYGGGRASDAATGAPPFPGLGPGGSLPATSSESAGYAGYQGSGGQPGDGSSYGDRLLFPLLGGSGGGGGTNQGGGGGGGALLLASSGIIRVDGAIHADSGSGGGISGGGTGSGGALRLVANQIHGTGSVLARTLGHSLTRGRVRLEAFRIAPALQTEQAAVTAPPIALEPRRPALIRVLSVAGQPVGGAPGGRMDVPDVVFQAAGEVTVEMETVGVPEGAVLTLRATGEGAAVTVESPPVDAQGRATVRLALPRGEGTLQAYGYIAQR